MTPPNKHTRVEHIHPPSSSGFFPPDRPVDEKRMRAEHVYETSYPVCCSVFHIDRVTHFYYQGRVEFFHKDLSEDDQNRSNPILRTLGTDGILDLIGGQTGLDALPDAFPNANQHPTHTSTCLNANCSIFPPGPQYIHQYHMINHDPQTSKHRPVLYLDRTKIE